MDNKGLVDIILASADTHKIKELVKKYGKESEWQDVLINIEDSYFDITGLFKSLRNKKIDHVLNFGICEVVATLRVEDTSDIKNCIDIFNTYFIDAETNDRDKESARVYLLSSIWDGLYNSDSADDISAHVTCIDVSHNKVKLGDRVYYLNFSEERGWITFYPDNKKDKKFKACCVFLDKDGYEILYTPDKNKYYEDERIKLMPPKDSVLYIDDCEEYEEEEIDSYEFNTNGTY